MKKVILLLIVIATIVSCKKKDVTPTTPVVAPIEYKAGYLVGTGASYLVTDVKVVIDSDTLGKMDPDHLIAKNAADIYAGGVVPSNAVLRPVEINKEFTIKVIFEDSFGSNLLHTFTGKITKDVNEKEKLIYTQTSEWQNPNITGSGILQATTKSINGTIVFVIFIS